MQKLPQGTDNKIRDSYWFLSRVRDTMSIESLIPDMKGYTDPHYLILVKKINELIKDSNDSFRSDLAIRNEITTLKKELHDLTNLVRNR